MKRPTNSKMHATCTVTISLDNQSKEIGLILGRLPITLTALFNLVFKLWELRIKCPQEYENELFSAVTSALHSSALLQKQLKEANRLNLDEELSQSEVADRLINIGVSKVNAVIHLLDQPLQIALKPIMDNYSATINKVTLLTHSVGTVFAVELNFSQR